MSSLINVGGLIFDENMPLRDQPPLINTVAGALDIQQVFEWSEWVAQAGNPVAYAPYLRRAPSCLTINVKLSSLDEA